MVAAAGANVLVTAVFGVNKSVAAAMELLRNALTQVAQ
jgi:hypothetical protein